jgi:male-specific lethal 1
MERGYTPDGWLGFIVGAKLFYEFSQKYPFEDKMKALLKEIDTVLGGSEDVPDSGNIIKPQIASVSHED